MDRYSFSGRGGQIDGEVVVVRVQDLFIGTRQLGVVLARRPNKWAPGAAPGEYRQQWCLIELPASSTPQIFLACTESGENYQ